MAEQRPFLLRFYRALARGLTPLFHGLFWLRSRSGKEVAARKGERFGVSTAPRPSGKLIWVHAASVGETTSVLPLIERLTAAGHKVLLTTVTVTAAELAEKRLPDGARHQFMPFDAPGPLKRFLTHWSPDLTLIVESEIWPCLFDELRSRKIPLVLLNARLSDKSFHTWSKVGPLARFVFSCPDRVLAQSSADAKRFSRLGSLAVDSPGNLKFDADAPPVNGETVALLEQQIAGRKLWLAALTHPGEEDAVLAAHIQLQQTFPDLLLVLVPRHPVRAGEVCGLATKCGLEVITRSSGALLSARCGVFLGDTLGEMGLFYSLAPVTFLGGSFGEAGGHNPVEAALVGSALLTGPKVANARAVYKEFWSKHAAIKVEEPEDLAAAVAALLRTPRTGQEQACRARAIVEEGRGALNKTLTILAPYLTADSCEPAAGMPRDTEALNGQVS